MAGINRTAPLKFNHPGLATTATRAGARLVIQNDIGTTDAHVIVIHVQDLTVTVTYTDVHPERLAFFQDMLEDTRRHLGSAARRPCWPPARRSISPPGASTARTPTPAAPISTSSARAWCS